MVLSFRTSFLVLCFALNIHLSKAFAWDISPVVALNYSIPSINALGTTGSSSGFTGGGGGLFGQDFLAELAVETGVLYLPRNFGSAGSAPTQTESRLHLPLVVRYELPVLQVFGGVYYSLGLGVSVSGASVSYASLNQSSSDFGLLAGLGKIFPVSANLGILLRSQFMFGLANASTNPLVSLYYRDIQFLGGVNLKL